ncbi:isoleucine-tRNA ligase [Lignoscripta atroalba]|nr:isoleucine-tRNA ligase [Lignoscripta atroalba]
MPIPNQILRVSWSSTLRLPKSIFPARAVIVDRPKYLKRCTDDLYAWQSKLRDADEKDGSGNNSGLNRPSFTIHDGPPYANGSLHIGHALNKILKDITGRFQLSQGRRVDYIPGWDCHGLPIELKALQQQRELGLLSEDRLLGAVAIRKAARQLATTAVEEQKEGFRGWGIMAGWDNAWNTMDKGFELKQMEVFKGMVGKGLIYRRFKPVYWSPSSRTALAEAELEYKEDHVSTAAYIRFPLKTLRASLTTELGFDTEGISAVIWTTTPWTLLANKAIAIHTDLDYVVVASADHGRLLLASSRVSEVTKLCNLHLIGQASRTIHGSELIGATYEATAQSDGADIARPIFHARWVSADSGSGLVHLAPGHGMDDYELCLKNGISAFAPLDDEGRFTNSALPSDPTIFAGKEVLNEGNKAVLDYLTERGLVLKTHKFKHKYPYDWRSKQPVIIRATEQWFANVGEIREDALHSLDAVKFIPEGGKERLQSFVRTRTEWCISRQRAWGVPIPALYHQETGQAVLDTQSVSHIISVIEDRGIDAWWTDDEIDPAWVPPDLRDKSGHSQYRRGKDTMDVWFDSGTSWTQFDEGNSYPADVYLEGTDQHRGWFQSSLLTYIAHRALSATNGRVPSAPFKTLITHGFTLDQTGRKMSKSIGNVISPDEIMNGTLLPPVKRKKVKADTIQDKALTYDAMGPDALRLWVAGSDYTKDVIIGQPVLKAINSSLSKYRVTFKLLLGILEDYDPAGRLPFEELTSIDQAALMQLKQLDIGVRRNYEEYEYYKAVNAINKYINSDLSSFYIETAKDRIYADAAGSRSRRQAQATLWHIFRHLQTMLSPITPLLIEEVWDYTPETLKRNRAHPMQETWCDKDGHLEYRDGGWENEQLQFDLPHLLAANVAVKSAQEMARGDKKMGSSLQSFVMLVVDGAESKAATAVGDLFHRYEAELDSLFVVSKVDICAGSVPDTVSNAEWQYSADFKVNGVEVVAHVYAPQDPKCVRCWRYAVLKGPEIEELLCPRCVGVLEGLRGGQPDIFVDHPHLDAAAAKTRHSHHVGELGVHWDHRT